MSGDFLQRRIKGIRFKAVGGVASIGMSQLNIFDFLTENSNKYVFKFQNSVKNDMH